MKGITLAIFFASIIILGAVIFSRSGDSELDVVGRNDNVTIVDGRQIIDLKTKGGYEPRRTIAQAGLPTIVRFNTQSTFDCSSAVTIPAFNVYKYLPQTGATEISLGTPKAGLLQGTCTMGMYRFEIDFKEGVI